MTSVTILPSQFILQKGSRRTPAPTSEKAFTLAHISALFNDITERPSFKKNAWPWKRKKHINDKVKTVFIFLSLSCFYIIYSTAFNKSPGRKRLRNNTLNKFFDLSSSFITLSICEHQIQRK